MQLVKFDEQKKEVVFMNPEAGMTIRYPIGEQLISFLEIDFSAYDDARLRLLELFKRKEVSPEKMLEAAIWLVNSMIEIDLLGALPVHPFPPEPLTSNHSYISASVAITTESDYDKTDVDVQKKYDYKAGQAAIREALRFCLDVDYSDKLGQFTAKERFLIGDLTTVFHLPVEQHPIKYIFDSYDIHRYFQAYVDFANDDEKANLVGHCILADQNSSFFKKMRKSFDNHPFEIIDGFSCENPLQLATLELMQMIKMDMKVRRCANCGRFFIVKRENSSRYCTRTPEGGDRTCKGIGATKDWNQNKKDDKLLSSYTRAYNRKYARKSKQGFIPEEERRINFKEWVKQATLIRSNARDGKITESEAIEWFDKA